MGIGPGAVTKISMWTNFQEMKFWCKQNIPIPGVRPDDRPDPRGPDFKPHVWRLYHPHQVTLVSYILM